MTACFKTPDQSTRRPEQCARLRPQAAIIFLYSVGMQNRFNRPFGAPQVEALIFRIREAAMSRQESDSAGSDVLFKSLHMITTLWRECAFHDDLSREAEQVLDATETRLKECLEKQSVGRAAEALAEVARLNSVFKAPPERHDPWPDEPEDTGTAQPR